MNIETVKHWLNSRKRKRPATGIILHASGGSSADGAISWLEKIGLSYHYIIAKDGTVTKLVPTGRVAFHAGKSEGWGGPNCNEYTIGICLANKDDGVDVYTKAQTNACADLIQELYKAIPTLRYISTHAAIAPKRKVDPRGFIVGYVNGPLEMWRCR